MQSELWVWGEECTLCVSCYNFPDLSRPVLCANSPSGSVGVVKVGTRSWEVEKLPPLLGLSRHNSAVPSRSLVTRAPNCLTAPDPDLRPLGQRGQRAASARRPPPFRRYQGGICRGSHSGPRLGQLVLCLPPCLSLILTLQLESGRRRQEGKPRPAPPAPRPADGQVEEEPPSHRDLGTQRRQAALRHAGDHHQAHLGMGPAERPGLSFPRQFSVPEASAGIGCKGSSAKGSCPASSFRLKEGGEQGPVPWCGARLGLLQ